MSQNYTPDQEVLLHGIKGVGVANEGEAAYIDLDDGGKRVVRLGVHRAQVPLLVEAFGQLDAALVKHSQFETGGQRRKAVAKKAEDVKVTVHEQRRAAVFEFPHPNGTVSFIGVEEHDLDRLIEQAAKAKEALGPPPTRQ